MKQHLALALVVSATWHAPVAASSLRSALMASERAMWNGWKNRDPAPFRTILTPDAVQIVTGTGELRGRETIARYMAMPSCTVRGFLLDRPTLKMLGASIALLSYTAGQDVSCAGARLPRKLRVTAIYVRQDKRWRASRYQETPID